MRFRPTLLLAVAAFFCGNALCAQTSTSTSNVDEPNPADFEIAAEDAPPVFAQVPSAVRAPEPPSGQENRVRGTALDRISDSYRRQIEQFSKQRHTFVHCELKNGRVLTGLLRDVSEEGFELKTDAVTGVYLRYGELAKPPRQVAAVGTRLKHGAEWTGLVILAAAALPIFIPLMLTGVVSDC